MLMPFIKAIKQRAFHKSDLVQRCVQVKTSLDHIFVLYLSRRRFHTTDLHVFNAFWERVAEREFASLGLVRLWILYLRKQSSLLCHLCQFSAGRSLMRLGVPPALSMNKKRSQRQLTLTTFVSGYGSCPWEMWKWYHPPQRMRTRRVIRSPENIPEMIERDPFILIAMSTATVSAPVEE